MTPKPNLVVSAAGYTHRLTDGRTVEALWTQTPREGHWELLLALIHKGLIGLEVKEKKA